MCVAHPPPFRRDISMFKLIKLTLSLAPKFLGALSLVAGLSISAAANASVIKLTVAEDDPKTFGFGNTFTKQAIFFDTFSFSFGGTSDLSFSLISFPATAKKDISGLSFELFHDIAGKNSQSMGFFGQANTLVIGSSSPLDHDFLKVAAGNYHVDIKGNAYGTGGGTYAGSMTVSAVPEPETYAMMLAGLGLIAVLSRRRKNVGPSAFAA
ncbi:PEP-CTERM sorting domain-containing protein [Undibacterium parvum]|uniref:PEP-CTERM sorting domain-containing protein n=2 Tax=Undibacterium parvum TaxID=401471 RepID=A0A3Q9BNE5_9BURK|nr:PEP-CTERM sorting domain-containing protein [Undibacterium parvum]